MVEPTILKIISQRDFSIYRAARKIRNFFFYIHRNPSRISTKHHLLSVSSCRLQGRKDFSLLFNFHNSLLRSNSLFAFFMTVAFEAGGVLKAVLLLLAYPFILLIGSNTESALRVMVFITFCGLKCKDMDVVVRAVLPKIYMDDIDRLSFEVASKAGRRVVVSSLPKIMVEKFVDECFGVSEVLGPDLEVVGGRYFTGRMIAGGKESERLVAVKDRFEEDKADVGLVNFYDAKDHLLIPYSKEVYAVTPEESTTTKNSSLARKNYPKPLIFHDGRLAFLPNPSNSLSLFLYLPFASLLSILRIFVGIILPYSISLPLTAALGIRLRVRFSPQPPSNNLNRGILFVCTHRTLLDPIILSHALSRPIPVVTYSLSRLSESISPIPTVRLTRDRLLDSQTMRRLLLNGDLAVCPEGTTCREPYLLRFSPLFAELTDDIEPVAIDADCSMFYATTATGMKSLDPLFFFMNPRPGYLVSFLGRVPKKMTVAGGWSAADVANRIQRELAEDLGFQCTTLTRRDKYLLLAGNDGVLPASLPEKCSL